MLAERIGEILMRIGMINRQQVEEILGTQEQGDPRTFGEIALNAGYIGHEAIADYLEEKKKSLKKKGS